MEEIVNSKKSIAVHLSTVKVKGVLSAAMGILFLVVSVTGLALLNAPTGKLARVSSWAFLGLSRWDLMSLHDYAGIAMTLVVLAHVVLNFNLWICEIRALRAR